MSMKVGVFLLLAYCAAAQVPKFEWELAMVIKNEIKLLQSNGSVIESLSQPFSSLKALAYDSAREQFIVSDMDNTNDTIYTVRIKETDITMPIIQGLPGDVQGLAVDPIDDNLYWTDAINHTINYVSLKSDTNNSKKFLVFKEQQPHSVAVDVCKRYIYWTNLGKQPSIERARLNGSDHQVVVNTSLMTPQGITIDYKAQRLYWADARIGAVGGVIESVNFDGTDRRVVVERSSMIPFGIAVDEHAIYWTDTNNMALYKFMKHSHPDDDPKKLLEFDEMPMGIVANNDIIKEEPDCRVLETAIEEYKTKENDYEGFYHIPPVEEEQKQKDCLNDGILVGSYCKCKRGFIGDYCETSICHNFCMHGDCYLTSMGKPKCRCDPSFTGERCHVNKCDGFCLNGGQCLNYVTMPTAKCVCPEGFIGDRCEIKSELCSLYCEELNQYGLFLQEYDFLCSCTDGASALRQNQSTAYLMSPKESSILLSLNQPTFYMGLALIFCVAVIIGLIVYARTIEKRRPRIRKRFIVNKNVTPLTYRPQPPPEQCAVTIECCNMNICETPCFEPKEDRKKLLQNMENEDF